MYRTISVVVAGALLGCLAFTARNSGQTKYQSAGGVKIIVEGTSNIHDWDMQSDKGTCTAIFEVNNAGALTSLTTLSFSVPVESIKSEHKAMGKNTYKALNSDKYASISFVSGAAVIKPTGTSGYLLTTNGKLTISGVTKDVQLSATGVVNPDKSITYSGAYQLKMTDYNVQPPSIMLGTIKTGNAITVKYNLVLKAI